MLKFAPLQSCVDASFWSELGEHKLHALKLSEAPVDIHGWLGPARYAEVHSQVQLDAESFATSAIGATELEHTAAADQGEGRSMARAGLHTLRGKLLNTNTLSAFKAMDRRQLMGEAAQQVWQDILSGAAESDPSKLCPFLLTAHGDLKKFHFHYWFAFPALKPPAPFTAVGEAQPLSQAISPEAAAKIAAACDAWRALPPDLSAPPFTSPPSQQQQQQQQQHATPHFPLGPPPFWLLHSANGTWHDTQALPLSAWPSLQARSPSQNQGEQQQGQQGQQQQGQTMLAFSDPCSLPGHPGWPLRNALLLAAVRWGVTELQVLCVRDQRGRTGQTSSLLLQVSLPACPPDKCGPGSGQVPEAVGWEANKDGKLAPRMVDLGPLLSSHQLAEQAVDLNLALMRWRAAPDLNVGVLSRTKCLLLGAGTLGCAVARTLLAWGVRHITFVDSSHVSFSNPVRQSLYEFEDCLGGGKPKAEAASQSLKRIFPSVHSQGHALSIPMPGHPPLDAQTQEAMRQDTAALDTLVREHDAVFLLTDTRESRWLPSLLAAAHGKIAITSAIGFDSFLVMRHGAPPPSSGSPFSTQGPRLGCYFCNDVVAPVNSTRDRALDQQCTVARPGLAPIAGALCVELLSALLQHPQQVGVKPLGATSPEWDDEAPTQLQGRTTSPPDQRQGAQHTQQPDPPLNYHHQQQQQHQLSQQQQSDQQRDQQHSKPSHMAKQGVGATATTAPHEPAHGALGGVPHMLRGNLTGFSLACMEGRAFCQCTACSNSIVRAYGQQGWDLVLCASKEPSYLEELTGLAALQQAMQQHQEAMEARTSQEAAQEGSASEGGEDWTQL